MKKIWTRCLPALKAVMKYALVPGFAVYMAIGGAIHKIKGKK